MPKSYSSKLCTTSWRGDCKCSHLLQSFKISLGVPFWKVCIDRTLAFLLYRILRYRIGIVRKNLEDCFNVPGDPPVEELVGAYYRYLGKIIRQVFVWPTQSLLEKRMSHTEVPEIRQWLDQGKSIVIVTGHTGNWEWTGAYLGVMYKGYVYPLYKRIKSGLINRFFFRRRISHVAGLIESSNMSELVRLLRSRTIILCMIADQNPASEQGMVWVPFFGRKTAFTSGPESLARRYRLPVVYMHTAPVPNGGYHLTGEIIYDGEGEIAPGMITGRYAERLEHNIRQYPESWLWSHKRWKRNTATP